LLSVSWPLTALAESECEGNKYKSSANGDCSGAEERNRQGRRAAEKGDDACLTQADSTHVCIEAELKPPARPTLLDSRGHDAIVQLLLEKGPDVNAQVASHVFLITQCRRVLFAPRDQL